MAYINGSDDFMIALKGDKGDKGDPTEVLQNTGVSETAVMSQKAVTDALGKKQDKLINWTGHYSVLSFGPNHEEEPYYRQIAEADGAYTMPVRSANGQLKATDPIEENDLVTKRYADKNYAQKGEGGGSNPVIISANWEEIEPHLTKIIDEERVHEFDGDSFFGEENAARIKNGALVSYAHCCAAVIAEYLPAYAPAIAFSDIGHDYDAASATTPIIYIATEQKWYFYKSWSDGETNMFFYGKIAIS